MNLLDQLANFCPGSVSISLLDPFLKQPKDQPRQVRHHSVFSHTKVHDDRNAKSIDKIQTYTPLNKGEQKKKIIMKISKTLSSKVRRHLYTFWVNLQTAIKNKKATKKQENLSQAAEKLSNFFSSYQIKYQQSQGISKAFSQIMQFSRIRGFQSCLENALFPAVKRQKQQFIKILQQKQNLKLRLEIFLNSLELIVFNKIKLRFFKVINEKSLEAPNIRSQNSTKISTLHRPCLVRKSLVYEISLQQPYSAVADKQKVEKVFGKLCIDNAVESTVDICDSHLIFIQRPQLLPILEFENQEKICTTQPSSACCKTKRCNSKQDMLSYSQILNLGSPCRQINLIDKQKTLKKQYSTPTHRSASTASIFNVDQLRISKLQKKLFGNINLKENNRSPNRQDWKTDRKALQQIICNINCSQRSKRNSTYQSQIQKLQEKIEYYKEKANQRYKQQSKASRFLQKQATLKNDRSFFLNQLKKRSRQEQNGKLEQKILISLKNKRKTLATVEDSRSKVQICQKQEYQQKLSNKAMHKYRKQ